MSRNFSLVLKVENNKVIFLLVTFYIKVFRKTHQERYFIHFGKIIPKYIL